MEVFPEMFGEDTLIAVTRDELRELLAMIPLHPDTVNSSLAAQLHREGARQLGLEPGERIGSDGAVVFSASWR